MLPVPLEGCCQFLSPCFIIPGRTLPVRQEILERTYLLLPPTVALTMGKGFHDYLCHLEFSS